MGHVGYPIIGLHGEWGAQVPNTIQTNMATQTTNATPKRKKRSKTDRSPESVELQTASGNDSCDETPAQQPTAHWPHFFVCESADPAKPLGELNPFILGKAIKGMLGTVKTLKTLRSVKS